MDIAEAFGKIIEKHGSLSIEAKEEIRKLRELRNEDEGTRLHTDLALLNYESDDPSLDYNDERVLLDYKNRLQLTAEEIIAYATLFKYKKAIVEDAKKISLAKDVTGQIMAIDILLQHARGFYAQKEARTKSHIKLSDTITYLDHKVFYNGDLASSPRLNSQERIVWKLLSQCTKHPKNVSFLQLSEEVDSKGAKIFTRLDDSITSDIAKWNKDFKKFGVKVLRKDGNRIVLDEQEITKK